MVVLSLIASSLTAFFPTALGLPLQIERSAEANVSFRVRELACHGCSLEILKALVHAPGFVRVIETNVRPQVITIRYNAYETTPTLLARRIKAKTGWTAKQATESPEAK